MTYVVTDACIGVRGEGCMAVCPALCIHTEPEDRMSFIDPARCIDCGACAEACVVGAIYPDHAVPNALREFVELNAQWFRHRRGVRERVRQWEADAGSR